MPHARCSTGLSLSLGLALTLVLPGCALFKAASRPAPDVKVASTPAKIKRGAYLATNVMGCVGCHSPLNEAHLPLPDQLGAGGRVFGHAEGLPGEIVSANLTPDPATGIGSWTDGELVRAIREGVSRDGHALFPIMPYPNYRELSDDDTEAIVAYLRSLPPVAKAVTPTKLDFPLNFIVNTIPKPLEGPVAAPTATGAARGAWLVKAASCADCHTPMNDKGQPLPGKYLMGGQDFKDGGHVVKMANVTQDKVNGIGGWTDAQIEAALRTGKRPDGRYLSPVMPWAYYSGMEKQDMKDMIAYLRTVQPGQDKP